MQSKWTCPPKQSVYEASAVLAFAGEHALVLITLDAEARFTTFCASNSIEIL